MVFTLDPELLYRMAQLSAFTVSEIEKGVSFSKSVVEHNDWNCIERDSISEQVIQIKTKMLVLKEQLELFASHLSSASQTFSDMKNGWLSSMGEVDVAISSQMAINNVGGSNDVATTTMGSILKSLQPNDLEPIAQFESSSILEPLKVCEFSSFNFEKA